MLDQESPGSSVGGEGQLIGPILVDIWPFGSYAIANRFLLQLLGAQRADSPASAVKAGILQEFMSRRTLIPFVAGYSVHPHLLNRSTCPPLFAPVSLVTIA